MTLQVQRLLRLTLRYLPSVLAPVVTQLATLTVLARVLDRRQFGILALGQTGANLIVLLTASWAASAAYQFLSGSTSERAEYRRHISLLVWAQVLGTGLVGTVLAWALPPGAGLVVFHSLVAGLPAALLVVPLYVLRVTDEIKRFNGLSLARHAVPTAAGLLAVALHSETAQSYQAAYGLALLFLLPASIWLARGSAADRRSQAVSTAMLRRLLRFAVPLAPAYLLLHVLAFVDRFLIAALRNGAEAGAYAAAYSLGSFPMQFIAAGLAVACLPDIVRAWESGGAREAGITIARWARFNLVTTGVVTGVILLSAPKATALVLGVRYGDMAPVVMLIAVAEFVMGLQWFFQRPLMLLEQTRQILWAVAAASVLNVTLNVLFVPQHGAIASAWITLLTNVVFAASIYHRGRRAFRRHVGPIAGQPSVVHVVAEGPNV